MSPIVYLKEEQINSLFDVKAKEQFVIEGSAYGLDDYTVFHPQVGSFDNFPSKALTIVKFIILPKFSSFNHVSADVLSQFLNKKDLKPTLLIFLGIENQALKHKCYLANVTKSLILCEVKFVPEKSELYSRSKGLLETRVLSNKSVGIVGLGSGGSPVAIELAKAGIGHFVLIDFDRLELSNVSRHICGINDLGRYKTFAIRDAIFQKNPHAEVASLEINVNEKREECSIALSKTDLIICASDNDQSRFFLNEIALKHKIPAIFGRAITRAAGGDVLRVRPFNGPCYNCLYSQNVRQQGGDDEEISQHTQAKKLLPDYSSEHDLNAVIQVGLSSDIMPISNFMVKLALVELSRGLNSGIKSLEDDLVSDFYIWANRRDSTYQNWEKLEYNFNKPSILRWYGAKVKRDPNCMVCAS